jgi:hypothetical protein
MSLDNELHAALRRKEPPDGFRERVLAAISGGQALMPVPPERTGMSAYPPQRRAWRAVAAAVLLAALAGGGEAVRIVRAKQQMLTALHITSAKLRDARNHVISTR